MDTENVVVTKQDRKYKTLVTDIGKEKMTNAILNGKKVNVVMAAVGDGGGSYYLPTADMTALVHEVWRGAIASKEINSKSSNMVDVKFVLPGTVGGFTAREAALIDDEGDMIAVCNLPDGELTGSVLLVGQGGGGKSGDGSYTLPTATPFRLGGVKVGDGLTVDNEGKLSVDAANTEETTGALNEVFGAEDGK